MADAVFCGAALTAVPVTGTTGVTEAAGAGELRAAREWRPPAGAPAALGPVAAKAGGDGNLDMWGVPSAAAGGTLAIPEADADERKVRRAVPKGVASA